MKKLIALIGVITMIGTTEAAAPANSNAELLSIALIAKHEGFSSTVYMCPGGKKTIGYGFADPALVAKGHMTRKEADRYLGIRVRSELKFLRERVKGLTPRQEAACCSFIYNVGRTAFLNSTFYKYLQTKQYSLASRELLKWNHCNGEVLNGLTVRRSAEAKYLLG